MVSFNPDVQDQPLVAIPNFRAPHQPDPDLSKAIAIKGMGDVFEQAVKGADEMIKSYLTNTAGPNFEKMKDTEIQDLEILTGVRPAPQASSPDTESQIPAAAKPTSTALPYAATEATASVLPAPGTSGVTPQVPGSAPTTAEDFKASGVEDEATRRITALGTAMKMKPLLGTYYNGQANTYMRDLQERWGGPGGYGPFIRGLATGILGHDPGNAYRDNLYALAQAQQGNLDKKRERAMGWIHESKFIDNPNLLMNQINDPNSWQYNDPERAVIEAELPKRKLYNKSQLDQDINKGDIVTGTARVTEKFSEYKQDFYNNLKKQLDITDEKISKGLLATNIPPEQAMARAGMIDQMMQYLRQEGRKAFVKEAAAGVKVDDIINNQLADFQAIRDAYYKGDLPAAKWMERQVDLDLSGALYGILSDPATNADTRSKMQVIGALAGKFGPAIAPILNDAQQEMIRKGPNFGALSEQRRLQLGTKPGQFGSMNAEDVLKHFQTLDMGNTDKWGPGASQDRKYYELPAEVVEKHVIDPKYPAELRADFASNVFQGKYIERYQPGDKEKIFARLTQPKATQAIWELSGNGTTDLWKQYKDWGATNGSIMAGPAVQTVGKTLRSVPIAQAGYNSETHEFALGIKPGVNITTNSRNALWAQLVNRPTGTIGSWMGLESPQDAVKTINLAIKPIAQTAIQEGKDPNVAVLQWLQQKNDPMAKILLNAIIGPSKFDQKSQKRSDIEPVQAPASFAGIMQTAPAFVDNTIEASAKRRVASLGPADVSGGPAYAKPMGDVNLGIISGRDRFRKELEANPQLREKVLGIVNAEHIDPDAQVAVLESMMNRADMHGWSLEKAARVINEGDNKGYYPTRKRITPAQRDQLERVLSTVLSGSNVSDFATDNASQGLAAKQKRPSGNFEFRSEFGQKGGIESFFAPKRWHREKYDRWLANQIRPGNSALMAESE